MDRALRSTAVVVGSPAAWVSSSLELYDNRQALIPVPGVLVAGFARPALLDETWRRATRSRGAACRPGYRMTPVISGKNTPE